MYEDLVKSLRTDHDKYFARDMEAANAIEDLINKVMQAENDSGLYDELPMMVLSEAKEPKEEA